jgi:hypothetical protein
MDTRMNIKKLIASVVIALTAFMGIGVAQAQTNYDFSAGVFGDGNGTPLYTTKGQISVSDTGVFTYSNFSVYFYPSGNPMGAYPAGSIYTDKGSSITHTSNFNLNVDVLVAGNTNNYRQLTPTSAIEYLNMGSPWTGSYTTLTCTSGCGGGGAPEIDGSLAPKVGFLLGCLFLMFGRKKQNTEPMMTA